MSDDDAPRLEFSSRKAVKAARKAHRCSCCGKEIAIGQPYTRSAEKVDGDFQVGAECSRCQAMDGLYTHGGAPTAKDPEYVAHLEPAAGLSADAVDDFYYTRGESGMPYNGWAEAVKGALVHVVDPLVGRIYVRADYNIWNGATFRFEPRSPIVLEWRRGQGLPDRNALHENPPKLPDTVEEEAACQT